jgi:hypothetical protein
MQVFDEAELLPEEKLADDIERISVLQWASKDQNGD